MRILVGDKGNVDLDSPVKLSPERQAEFIAMMKGLFRVVLPTPGASPRTARLGEAFFQREWTKQEYELLLAMENLETVAQMLGRTHMSVNMQRGWFMPAFMTYVHNEGIDFYADLEQTKKLIAKFLEEKKIEQLVRRQQRLDERRERRRLEDQCELLKDKVETIEERQRAGRFSPLIDEAPLRRAKEDLALVEQRLKELGDE